MKNYEIELKMNQKKYADIAKQLIEESNIFKYTVISDSMYPLISKNDKIICKKKECKKIKKYSLIAFYADSDTSQVPTVHRVIKIFNEDGGLSFRTKGDNNFNSDKNKVYPHQIIGVVEEIIKKNFVISLTKKSQKYISALIYFILQPINFIIYCYLKIKNALKLFFAIEKQPLHDDGLIVLRQSFLTKSEDWHEIVNINTSLMEHLLNNDLKICDISFGGGYCEESLFFIRKGLKIDYKNIENSNNEQKYDFIICSRVLNIVDSELKRHEIYCFLKSLLKPDGKILISYVNEKNNLIVFLKRSAYKFFKNYSGPDNNDIIYKDIFIMKTLKDKKIFLELKNADLNLLKYWFYGKKKTFLLEYKTI